MIRISKWAGKASPDEKVLVKQLEAEGYSTHTWGDSPGTAYPDHQHEYEEVRWVISGTIKIGVGKTVYELGPGDRLDMPQRTVHWAKVTSAMPVRYVCGQKH